MNQVLVQPPRDTFHDGIQDLRMACGSLTSTIWTLLNNNALQPQHESGAELPNGAAEAKTNPKATDADDAARV